MTASIPLKFPDPKSPLVIGGLGGSGTRLVAEVAKRLGIFIGFDLNNANDNLSFTLLLKRPSAREPGQEEEAHASLDLFPRAMIGTEKLTRDDRKLIRAAARETPRPHDRKWLQARAKRLSRRSPSELGDCVGWGWKEPNSHIFLDYLIDHFPELRYVHVVRHGLDMAVSKNHQQINNWHAYYGMRMPNPSGPSPSDALHFWRLANQRAIELAQSLGSRFLLVNYDDLCVQPDRNIPVLVSFISGEDCTVAAKDLVELPHPPASMGRHIDLDRTQFDPADVDFVRAVGFRVY